MTSIFIPHVFFEVTIEQIKDVIEYQECIGVVDKIDLVERTDAFDKLYNMAYIHMKSWNDTESAQNLLQAINNNEKTLVYYDSKNKRNNKGPYWTILKNKLNGSKHKKTPSPVKPKLVRSCAITMPYLYRDFSIYDGSLKNGRCNTPVNLMDDFNAVSDIQNDYDESVEMNILSSFGMIHRFNELNTFGLIREFKDAMNGGNNLVSADYVERLEREIATLNCVIDSFVHEQSL